MTCTAQHACFNSVEKSISLTDLTSPSLIPSAPEAKLFWSSEGLLCLVSGFSPAAINITWFLNGKIKLVDYNTTVPSRGPDGKFICQSNLRLSSFSWVTKPVYTCKVSHVIGTLEVHISDPQTFNDGILDTITDDLGHQDNAMEIWTATCTFLALFLISFVYSVFVTFAKMK
ncbi:immunoglobulin D heavy chain constant region variant a [Arapaima gigas]